MQRAVHMFKRVGTAWIMSGLRMLRSCITTYNNQQLGSKVFRCFRCLWIGNGRRGRSIPHVPESGETDSIVSNCHSWEVPSLKLHWASKTSHPRTPLKVNASHALIVQYAVKWCGATIISYSTPAFLTRHCKPEYISMFGVRCTSTSQYSSHHARLHDLCIRFVRLYSLGDNQSLSTSWRSLKHPILFNFARSEEYPREALPRGAGGCLSEVLL